jgi:hypothetical protein
MDAYLSVDPRCLSMVRGVADLTADLSQGRWPLFETRLKYHSRQGIFVVRCLVELFLQLLVLLREADDLRVQEGILFLEYIVARSQLLV